MEEKDEEIEIEQEPEGLAAQEVSPCAPARTDVGAWGWDTCCVLRKPHNESF